jgi:actin-related protein 5
LDEEQIKEKRRQRLMKAGYDARVRARAEKLKEQEERAAEIKRDEEERNRDPVKWAANLRQAHQVCLATYTQSST